MLFFASLQYSTVAARSRCVQVQHSQQLVVGLASQTTHICLACPLRVCLAHTDRPLPGTALCCLLVFPEVEPSYNVSPARSLRSPLVCPQYGSLTCCTGSRLGVCSRRIRASMVLDCSDVRGHNGSIPPWPILLLMDVESSPYPPTPPPSPADAVRVTCTVPGGVRWVCLGPMAVTIPFQDMCVCVCVCVCVCWVENPTQRGGGPSYSVTGPLRLCVCTVQVVGQH